MLTTDHLWPLVPTNKILDYQILLKSSPSSLGKGLSTFLWGSHLENDWPSQAGCFCRINTNYLCIIFEFGIDPYFLYGEREDGLFRRKQPHVFLRSAQRWKRGAGEEKKIFQKLKIIIIEKNDYLKRSSRMWLRHSPESRTKKKKNWKQQGKKNSRMSPGSPPSY